MPKYFYKCSSCEESFLVRHLMCERIEMCEKCGERDCLKKLPLFPVNLQNKKKKKKVGEIVNSHIEETKEELKKEKEKMKQEEYKS